ncbi:hypothetical protein ACVW1A_007910 [Bradyrhizobium sp. LB1.3]|uniref:hypothetical protein n=1 Tax=unclassified Bradyrhizobium TaxID=2631580 RepID=UPI003397711D
MAKLNVDFTAVKIRELLNHGKTKEATKLARETIATGNAKPETQKLAAMLLAGGRGRKSSGLHKWIEIGHANYWMEAEGVSRRDRLLRLVKDFRRGDKHVEACITAYNKAISDAE